MLVDEHESSNVILQIAEPTMDRGFTSLGLVIGLIALLIFEGTHAKVSYP